MTAADQIAEINRQREERHRVVDAECDARIRMVPHECEPLVIPRPNPTFGIVNVRYPHCKHCGAPMP